MYVKAIKDLSTTANEHEGRTGHESWQEGRTEKGNKHQKYEGEEPSENELRRGPDVGLTNKKKIPNQ